MLSGRGSFRGRFSDRRRMDRVDQATRSRMMSGIGSAHTKPELKVRSILHRQGFRFRLHRKDLPGRPDIALPKHRAVVFVHGCFWHGHSCPLFVVPKTRTEFWLGKIAQNQRVDERAARSLLGLGWRRAVVWECALRGRSKIGDDSLGRRMGEWLLSAASELTVEGSWTE